MQQNGNKYTNLGMKTTETDTNDVFSTFLQNKMYIQIRLRIKKQSNMVI